MAFVPHTGVYLLDTPLDNKYKNQIKFSSLEAQHNYFVAQIKHTFSNVTYQRKNNSIRVDEHIDNLWNVNYVMYQNTNFTTKWFYAFITRMEYVSDRATDIFIETDVYQTWLFNCEIKESFVVREHVADDTIGKHLVDEQLETGEYIMETYSPVGKLGSSWIIMAVSDNTPMGSSELIGNLYGHVPTGLTYWPFTNDIAGIAAIKSLIQSYTTAGKADAIVMLFVVPELIIEDAITDPDWHFGLPIPSSVFYGYESFFESKRLSTLDGYTPKNHKMFTYPYKFLYATNSNGLSASYRYEDFPSNEMNFVVTGSIMPNPKVMLVPQSYKGSGSKYEYGLSLEGFPLGSWVTDTYAAWLAQNGASTAINLIGSTVALIGGVATGGIGLLAAGGGAFNIANQLAQIHQASIQPDQAKGQVGSGNTMFGIDALDFYFSHMSIKAEFAKRIDQFFTMFGYKVNTLKVPELHSRTYWNYVQTIDVNIDGAIPADDMQRLKKVYDEGVTLWHTTANFLDYSLTNSIR